MRKPPRATLLLRSEGESTKPLAAARIPRKVADILCGDCGAVGAFASHRPRRGLPTHAPHPCTSTSRRRPADMSCPAHNRAGARAFAVHVRSTSKTPRATSATKDQCCRTRKPWHGRQPAPARSRVAASTTLHARAARLRAALGRCGGWGLDNDVRRRLFPLGKRRPECGRGCQDWHRLPRHLATDGGHAPGCGAARPGRGGTCSRQAARNGGLDVANATLGSNTANFTSVLSKPTVSRKQQQH